MEPIFTSTHLQRQNNNDETCMNNELLINHKARISCIDDDICSGHGMWWKNKEELPVFLSYLPLSDYLYDQNIERSYSKCQKLDLTDDIYEESVYTRINYLANTIHTCRTNMKNLRGTSSLYIDDFAQQQLRQLARLPCYDLIIQAIARKNRLLGFEHMYEKESLIHKYILEDLDTIHPVCRLTIPQALVVCKSLEQQQLETKQRPCAPLPKRKAAYKQQAPALQQSAALVPQSPPLQQEAAIEPLLDFNVKAPSEKFLLQNWVNEMANNSLGLEFMDCGDVDYQWRHCSDIIFVEHKLEKLNQSNLLDSIKLNFAAQSEVRIEESIQAIKRDVVRQELALATQVVDANPHRYPEPTVRSYVIVEEDPSLDSTHAWRNVDSLRKYRRSHPLDLTMDETILDSLIFSMNPYDILPVDQIKDESAVLDEDLCSPPELMRALHIPYNDSIHRWIEAHFRVYGPLEIPVEYIANGRRRMHRRLSVRVKRTIVSKAISSNDRKEVALKAVESETGEPTMLYPQNDNVTTTESFGDNTAEVSTTNVSLVENRDESIAEPMPLIPSAPAFGVKGVTFPELSQRFNNLGTFEWSVNDPNQQIIKVFDLPIDLTGLLLNNPATLPMNQYTFMKPQLTIRFQMNSTRFHQGALVAGVMYYPKLSAGTTAGREPVSAAQVIQLDFSLLDGSSSNIAQLKIPFQSHLQMIPIHDSKIGSTQYYCSVYVAVLSPLRTGPDNVQMVSITTQASLSCDGVDTEFYGLQPRLAPLRLIAQGPISNLIGGLGDIVGSIVPGVSEVSGLVSTVIQPIENLFFGSGRSNPASNMDKPVNPVESQKVLIVKNVNLSHGESMTQARQLRLNPATLTPHAKDTVPSGSDLLNLQTLYQKWGYVGEFTVQDTDLPGTFLYEIPLTPLLTAQVGDNFLPTPLAGVAGMFSYWSGSLEFRFILFKAQAHSVRLRFTAIPVSNDHSADSLMSCYNVIEDFEERSEVTIQSPYFGPTDLVPVTYNNEAVALGNITVSLESKLLSMNALSNSVDVVVLARASSNFELSVPKTNIYRPLIGERNALRVSAFCAPNQPQTLRVALNYDGVERTVTVTRENPFIATFLHQLLDYIVITRNTTCTAPNEIIVENYPSITVESSKPGTTDTFCNPSINIYKWDPSEPSPTRLTDLTVRYQNNDYFKLEPQNERETTVDNFNLGNNTTSGVGERNVGENFSLRSVLRRYQYLFGGTVELEAGKTKRLIYDVNFGTPFLRNANDALDNLSWCHDAYRFAKGSLSYNLWLNASDGANVFSYITHVPAGLTNQVQEVSVWNEVNDFADREAFAHELVYSNSNTIPFNVPYYNYVKYLINGYDPNEVGTASVSAYSMGSVHLDVTSDKDTTIQYRIERSLGDDADLYTFQGWPLCVNNLSITQWNTPATRDYAKGHNNVSRKEPTRLLPQNANEFETLTCSEPEALDDNFCDTITFLNELQQHNDKRVVRAAKRFRRKFEERMLLMPQNEVEAAPGEAGVASMMDKAKALLTKAKDKACSIFHDILSTIETLGTTLLTGLANKALDCLSDVMGMLLGTMSFARLYSLYYSIKVVIYGADMWAKGMALTNLFLQLGLFGKSSAVKVLMILTELLFIIRPSGLVRLVPQNEPNGEAVGNAKTLAAILMGGIAALAGFNSANSYSRGLSDLVRLFTTCANSWSSFFNGVGKVIIDYILYHLGYENPEVAAKEALKKVDADMESWVNEVMYLTNPTHHNEVISSPDLRKRVAKAYEIGNILLTTITKQQNNNLKFSFNLIYKQLSDLFKETGYVPDSVVANISPIVVWLDGPPGCGKSQFAETIGIRLAASLGIKYDGKPTFVLNPARKYMDGYNGQPIIIMDDALQVGGTEADSQFLQHWFGLVTNAPYTAEFSAISEKKKFVTPSIVIVCANAAFPEPPVRDITAFYRRRDFLIRCELNEKWLGQFVSAGENKIKNLNDMRITGFTEKFDHLKFNIYPSTYEKCNVQALAAQNWCGYDSLMYTVVKNSINLYRRRCEAAVKNIDLSKELLPEMVQEVREQLLSSLKIDKLTQQISENLALGKFDSLSQPETPENDELELIREIRVGELQPQNEEEEVKQFICDPLWNGDENENTTYEDDTPIREMYRCNFVCKLWKDGVPTASYCTFRKDIGDLPHTFYNIQFCGCRRVRLNLSDDLDFVGELRLCDKGRDSFCNECYIQLGSIIENYIESGTIAGMHSDMIIGNLPRTYARPYTHRNWIGIDTKPLVNWWSGIKSSILSFLDAHKMSLVILAAILMTCCGLISYGNKFKGLLTSVKGMFNISESSTDVKSIVEDVMKPIGLFGQMASSGDSKTTRQAKRSVRIFPQNTSLVDRVYRNRCRIVAYAADGKFRSTFGLGIRGRYIMLTAHTFQGFDVERISIQLYGQHEIGGVVELGKGDFEYMVINNTDITLLHIINRRIPQFKNIVGSFVTGKQLSRVSTEGALVEADTEGKSFAKVHHFPIEQKSFVSSYEGRQAFNLVGFSYPYERMGLCGSILLDTRNQLIIGMHTSGFQGVGYASILCSDIFQNFDFDGAQDVIEPELEEGGRIEALGEFIPVGKLLEAQSSHMVCKTQIAESTCHGILREPVRKPVDMVSTGDKYPAQQKLRVAIEKGFKPTKPFPVTMIDEAHNDILGMFLAKAKPTVSARSKRDLNEAICGIPGVPFMESLRLNTSPGFPLSHMKRGSKKNDFIKTSIDEVSGESVLESMDPVAFKIYQDNHELRRKGTIPFSPYQNFLKDERLKPGKNPRLVNGASLDTVLEFRRYTLDFVSAMQNNNIECEVAVGINIHGPEWSNMVQTLLSMGDSFGCGDYSGFGPGLDPELVIRSGEIINAWYDRYAPDTCEEDNKVRSLLFEELAFSKEVSVDTVIGTLCGSPSGNPLTVVVNSIVNLFYIRLAWLNHFKGTQLASLARFRENIKLVVYGDDILFTLSNGIKEMFNNQTISEELAMYGITYTDADKSGYVRPYCNMSEATLLKCYIIPHPTRGVSYFLAALEKPMIEDVCNWIRKPAPDRQQASLENSIETCRLAYAWGKDYHKTIVDKLSEFWLSRGKQLQAEGWDYLDMMYFGDLKGVRKDLYPGGLVSTWRRCPVESFKELDVETVL